MNRATFGNQDSILSGENKILSIKTTSKGYQKQNNNLGENEIPERLVQRQITSQPWIELPTEEANHHEGTSSTTLGSWVFAVIVGYAEILGKKPEVRMCSALLDRDIHTMGVLWRVLWLTFHFMFAAIYGSL